MISFLPKNEQNSLSISDSVFYMTNLPTFSPRGGISFCKLGAEDDPDMTAVLKRWANVDPWAANS